MRLLRAEPVVLHVREDHPLSDRESVSILELSAETLLVAGGPNSPGYTAAVVGLCRAAGLEPRTVPDPHPDLGRQSVQEGRGVVLYVASAYPAGLPGVRLVPVRPTATLPFHLAWREDARHPGLAALVDAAPSATR